MLFYHLSCILAFLTPSVSTPSFSFSSDGWLRVTFFQGVDGQISLGALLPRAVSMRLTCDSFLSGTLYNDGCIFLYAMSDVAHQYAR